MITEYQYNSEDQITFLYYQLGKDDSKSYYYSYDYAGRLKAVDYYTGPISDNPVDYSNFVSYEYNQNSQMSEQKFADNTFNSVYSYNNRNWISSMETSYELFDYENTYFKNGNVKKQTLHGRYNNNFTNDSDIAFYYSYDRSNRMIESSTKLGGGKGYSVKNTYDKDGNIITLDRNGITGNSLDDFDYSYYSGTNKLSRVKGSVNQYTYDLNGNMTSDSLNLNGNIIYDYRNLITQLKHRVIGNQTTTPDTTKFVTNYYYDESGNRIRKKVYKFIGTTHAQEIAQNLNNDTLWEMYNDEIYSRGVDGKELCIYKNGSVEQWNVWGADNVGKLIPDGDNPKSLFYLKDHLGSIRAIADDKLDIFFAEDYDAWGYALQNRVYENDESKFKFTSKERDAENGYDYFGARYYDARVGRWGGVEPLIDKYPQISTYSYSLLNPLKMIDANGEDAKVTISGNKISIDVTIYFSMDKGYFDSEYSQGLLTNYLQEAQNQWQEAFSQVSGYEVEFNINPEFVSSQELGEINSNIDNGISNSGENIAQYIPNEKNPGVDENYLRIVSMEGKSAPPYTGSHEIGHLIGFEHPYPTNSKAQKVSKNIMGYNHDRNKPNVYDAYRFLNKLDLPKQTQIVKGAKNVN